MMIVQQTKPAFYPITTEDVSATDMPDRHQVDNNRIYSDEKKLNKPHCSSEIIPSVQQMANLLSAERKTSSVCQKSADDSIQSSDPTLFSYTVADSFSKLCDIQETALSMAPKPDFTAALKSEELKGKLFGLYTDKKDKEKGFENLPQLLVEFIEFGKAEHQPFFKDIGAEDNQSAEQNSLSLEYI